MRAIISLITASLITAALAGLFAQAQAPAKYFAHKRKALQPAAAGASCTEWLNNDTTPEDYAAAASSWSQKIPAAQNTTGGTICQFKIRFEGTGTAHCEVWSEVNGGGTQFGGSSDTQTISGNAQYTFTWTSSLPVVTASADFFVRLVTDSGSQSMFVRIGGTYASTIYSDAALQVTGSSCFILYKQ